MDNEWKYGRICARLKAAGYSVSAAVREAGFTEPTFRHIAQGKRKPIHAVTRQRWSKLLSLAGLTPEEFDGDGWRDAPVPAGPCCCARLKPRLLPILQKLTKALGKCGVDSDAGRLVFQAMEDLQDATGE